MGYAVHIERDHPISLAEWKKAVEKTEGIRLDSSGSVGRNVATGEEIRIPGQDGDVSLFLPGEEIWVPFLSYSEYGISYRIPRDWDQESMDFFLSTVSPLAKELGAKIVGDDGEEYYSP